MKMFRTMLLALALMVGATATANAQYGNICPQRFHAPTMRYFDKYFIQSRFNFIAKENPLRVQFGDLWHRYNMKQHSVIVPMQQSTMSYSAEIQGQSAVAYDVMNASWVIRWTDYTGLQTRWNCLQTGSGSAGYPIIMTQLDPFGRGGNIMFWKLTEGQEGDGTGGASGPGDGDSNCTLYISYAPFTSTITSIYVVC